MIITLDIETIPAQNPEFLVELREKHKEQAEFEALELSPPKNYKSAEAIEKWWIEAGIPARDAIRSGAEQLAEEEYRKTSLDGAFGQIAVIGYACNDQDPVTVWSKDYQTAEAQILTDFYKKLSVTALRVSQPQFVGHNINGFDLRFIFQRSVVNGIRPPSFIPFSAKPWEQDKVFDTMTAWAGVGNRIKLDKLCKALGLPGKPNNIDGSKVWDFVNNGLIEEVAAYCADDVQQTYACFKKLTFAN